MQVNNPDSSRYVSKRLPPTPEKKSQPIPSDPIAQKTGEVEQEVLHTDGTAAPQETPVESKNIPRDTSSLEQLEKNLQRLERSFFLSYRELKGGLLFLKKAFFPKLYQKQNEVTTPSTQKPYEPTLKEIQHELKLTQMELETLTHNLSHPEERALPFPRSTGEPLTLYSLKEKIDRLESKIASMTSAEPTQQSLPGLKPAELHEKVIEHYQDLVSKTQSEIKAIKNELDPLLQTEIRSLDQQIKRCGDNERFKSAKEAYGNRKQALEDLSQVQPTLSTLKQQVELLEGRTLIPLETLKSKLDQLEKENAMEPAVISQNHGMIQQKLQELKTAELHHRVVQHHDDLAPESSNEMEAIKRVLHPLIGNEIRSINQQILKCNTALLKDPNNEVLMRAKEYYTIQKNELEEALQEKPTLLSKAEVNDLIQQTKDELEALQSMKESSPSTLISQQIDLLDSKLKFLNLIKEVPISPEGTLTSIEKQLQHKSRLEQEIIQIDDKLEILQGATSPSEREEVWNRLLEELESPIEEARHEMQELGLTLEAARQDRIDIRPALESEIRALKERLDILQKNIPDEEIENIENLYQEQSKLKSEIADQEAKLKTIEKNMAYHQEESLDYEELLIDQEKLDLDLLENRVNLATNRGQIAALTEEQAAYLEVLQLLHEKEHQLVTVEQELGDLLNVPITTSPQTRVLGGFKQKEIESLDIESFPSFSIAEGLQTDRLKLLEIRDKLSLQLDMLSNLGNKGVYISAKNILSQDLTYLDQLLNEYQKLSPLKEPQEQVSDLQHLKEQLRPYPNQVGPEELAKIEANIATVEKREGKRTEAQTDGLIIATIFRDRIQWMTQVDSIVENQKKMIDEALAKLQE